MAATVGTRTKRSQLNLASATQGGRLNSSSALPRRRTATILVAIATIGIAVLVLVRMLAKETWPQAGRLEGSTLIISSATGQELWRKSFPDGFWADYYEQGVASRLRFADLNGDGHLEVLFAYHPGVNPNSTSATLICYSDRGREEWRWTLEDSCQNSREACNLRHTGLSGSETVRQDTSPHRRFKLPYARVSRSGSDRRFARQDGLRVLAFGTSGAHHRGRP